MTIERDDIVTLPDDALPSIAELPGDLRRVAEIISPAVDSDVIAVRLVFNLSDEFGGTNISCPGLGRWKRKWRDQQIRDEYDAGRRVPEIARRYKLSERWVWDILGRLPVDEKQMRIWG